MVLLHGQRERMCKSKSKRDVGGWVGGGEFLSDSECKLVVENGEWRKRRQAVEDILLGRRSEGVGQEK